MHTRQNQQVSSDEANDSKVFTPADGGVRAWLVCLTGFCVNGTFFCVINTFGILSDWLITKLGASKSVAGSIGSLTTGIMYLFSFAASVLTDRFGIRRCSLIGAGICSCSCLASSFCADTSVELLYFTHSFLFGLGSTLLLSPSIVIQSHYFQRKLGLAQGLSTFGGGVFSVGMSLLLKPVLLDNIGLSNTFRVFCGMCLLMLVYAGVWKSQRPKKERSTVTEDGRFRCGKFLKENVNFGVWKNRNFVIWNIGCAIASFPMSAPIIFLPNFVTDLALQDLTEKSSNVTTNFTSSSTPATTDESSLIAQAATDAALIITCLNIGNSLSRVLFGKLADLWRNHGIHLLQVSFILSGISTILLPFITTIPWLIVAATVYGVGFGGQVALRGPIAFHMMGDSDASQALGFLFQTLSVPVFTGPLVAGYIKDSTGRWDIAFIVCGSTAVIGSLILLLIFVPREKKSYTVKGLSN